MISWKNLRRTYLQKHHHNANIEAIKSSLLQQHNRDIETLTHDIENTHTWEFYRLNIIKNLYMICCYNINILNLDLDMK